MLALRDLLEPKLARTLDNVERELARLFPVPGPHDPYTPHDPSHARKVEGYLDLLLTDEQKRSLSPEESFWLLAAVFFHDVGMATHRDVLAQSSDAEIRALVDDAGHWARDIPQALPEELQRRIRSEHSSVSVRYVRDRGEALGVDDGFSRYVISLLCDLHTHDWAKVETDPSLQALERSNKLLSLAALLRLADILHSDISRIEQARLHIEFLASLPAASWVHWAKHLVLQKVLPKPRQGVIDLVFFRPEGLTADEELLADSLVRSVRREIQDEVDRTRDTLTRSDLATFLSVRSHLIDNSREVGPLSREEARRVRFFLQQYKISQQLSASGVRESLLLSIDEIMLRSSWGKAGYQQQVLDPIEALLDFAYESYHGNRNIREIGRRTRGILRHVGAALQGQDREGAVEQGKRLIARHLDGLRADIDDQRAHLRQEAGAALAQLLGGDGYLLLYSFSKTVAECLAEAYRRLDAGLRVLIAECRNKCVGPFSDALAYASELVDLKLDLAEVKLVSDASIGYFLSGQDPAYRVSTVLMGMGDGWVHPEEDRFWILNSVGSRAVAGLAQRFGQAVVVLGESSKFSGEKPPSTRSRMRSNFGLDPDAPSVAAFLRRRQDLSLEQMIIDPVQDEVPSSEIALLVTDLGAFSNRDFANFVAHIRKVLEPRPRP